MSSFSLKNDKLDASYTYFHRFAARRADRSGDGVECGDGKCAEPFELACREAEAWCDVLDMAPLTRYEDGDQGYFSEDLTHFFARRASQGGTQGATGADYAIAFSV